MKIMPEELLYVNTELFAENVEKMVALTRGERKVMVKANWPVTAHTLDQSLFYQSFESELAYYIANFNMNVSAMQAGFDNIPYFRVDFGRVACLMAIAYGCAPLIGFPAVANHYLVEDDLSRLWSIQKKENIQECGFYPEITKRMLEIRRRFGDVPFVPSDTQSPIDAASQVVDTSLLILGTYDAPEAVHYLLSILTESIAEITIFQASIAGNWLGSGHDYPLPKGIHLSDDNAAFLSPAVYRNFARPYNESLSDRFGGVTLHCCMGQKQNISVMAETRGLLGFDPQIAYNPLETILEAIHGKGFWRIWDYSNSTDVLETCRMLIDRTQDCCGLLLDISADTQTQALKLSEQVLEYANQVGRR